MILWVTFHLYFGITRSYGTRLSTCGWSKTFLLLSGNYCFIVQFHLDLFWSYPWYATIPAGRRCFILWHQRIPSSPSWQIFSSFQLKVCSSNLSNFINLSYLYFLLNVDVLVSYGTYPSGAAYPSGAGSSLPYYQHSNTGYLSGTFPISFTMQLSLLHMIWYVELSRFSSCTRVSWQFSGKFQFLSFFSLESN